MSIRRTRTNLEDHYTQVDNAWVRDDRLSLKARGLFVQILSHREGWSISINSLVNANPEGDAAIRSALSELIEYGYLVRGERERNDKGHLGDYEYTLWAGRGLPTLDDPAVDPPTVENPTTKKTISKEDHLQESPATQEMIAAGGWCVPSADTQQTELWRDQLYQELWALWPSTRRSTHKEAGKAFAGALRVVGGKEGAAAILEAARRHAAVWRTWPHDQVQYIPLLPTWLNKERWTAPDPQPRAETPGQKPRRADVKPNDEWMYR